MACAKRDKKRLFIYGVAMLNRQTVWGVKGMGERKAKTSGLCRIMDKHPTDESAVRCFERLRWSNKDAGKPPPENKMRSMPTKKDLEPKFVTRMDRNGKPHVTERQ